MKSSRLAVVVAAAVVAACSSGRAATLPANSSSSTATTTAAATSTSVVSTSTSTSTALAGPAAASSAVPTTTVTRPVATSPPASTVPPLAVTWTTSGVSVQGRLLRTTTVGSGPRRVLWVGGIHGDEPEGKVATGSLPAAFAGAGLGAGVTLTILEDANPDGRVLHTRANANGVDLNRNFPAANFDATNPVNGGHPLSQPEAATLASLINSIRPQLIVVCHAWIGDTFVNFDGPAVALAQRFSADSGMPVRTNAQLGEATPGSLGTWAGAESGIAYLTIEFYKGSDAGHDWAISRSAILDVIAG